MLVRELNSVVFALLNSTYFLSDDELLEVDQTVLNFVTLPLHFLHIGLNAVYVPCHEWVSQDYFAEKLLLRVVVVNEGLHHMITDFFRCERRQVGMENEIFEIAELSLVWVCSTVQIFLILLNLHKFIVVPFKEWEDSLY